MLPSDPGGHEGKNMNNNYINQFSGFLSKITPESTLEAELQMALEPLKRSLRDDEPTPEELRQDHLEGERIDDTKLEYAKEIQEWEEQK